jgi:DNA-binding GntR family transcriptional regulator
LLEEFMNGEIRPQEEPLYVKVQDIIMKKIEDGEYLPGE